MSVRDAMRIILIWSLIGFATSIILGAIWLWQTMPP